MRRRGRRAPRRVVAGFDSATTMLKAVASYAPDGGLPLTGEASSAAEGAVAPAAGAANHAPRRLKERVCAAAGRSEAVPQRRVGGIDSDALASWAAGHYPGKQSEVAFMGASNGALTHPAAALEAPWLPQTLLTPVRRFGFPSEGGPDAVLARFHRELIRVRGRRPVPPPTRWPGAAEFLAGAGGVELLEERDQVSGGGAR